MVLTTDNLSAADGALLRRLRSNGRVTTFRTMSGASFPPGPRGLELTSAGVSAAHYLPGFFETLARRYGDVARVSLGPARFILVSTPELAKDLLVDHDDRFEKGRGERRFTQRLLGRGVLGSEGEFHRRQHHLLMPIVHAPAIDRFAQVMVERAVRMQEGWRDGQVVDVSRLLDETTLSVMVEVLFGASVDGHVGSELRGALTGAVDALEDLPVPVLPGSSRLPLPANRRFERVVARLDSLVLPMIAERRHAVGDGDLLSSLVGATHPDGGAMDDRLVRDEAMSIFRGHKTTGTAVAWTWHLISRHPDVEARLFEEIDAVLGDRAPTADDLHQLRYCRMVVDESMRLFPPAWMLARRAVLDHEMGGYRVPIGSTVITSSYVIHRDVRVHADARRFEPERFEPERRRSWHPLAYFPFGGGPKMCLGDAFAPFEAVLLLAVIGRRWRLRPAPGHRVEPLPKATLKLRHGLQVVLERR
jgi:cytochrome P450